MASNQELKIVLRAIDNASDEIQKVRSRIEGFGTETERVGKRAAPAIDRINSSLGGLGVLGAGAGLSIMRLNNEIDLSIAAANRYQAALTGLTSVANAFGQSSDQAKAAAIELSRDGLMSVTEAATGLKNLLAGGFSLDQAVSLMNRFKDSAAFGRQGALGFGEAIVGATEGIKNGNSILVDNAGVTKNLSVILEEAGFSAQDLMRATTDASVRQAIFNGILKETNPQLGDAARLSETFAGAQSRANVQVDNLRRQVGEALQPALLALLQALTPIIEKTAAWIQANPQLTATIIVATAAFLGVLAVLGAVAGAIALVTAAGITLTGFLIGAGIAAVVAFAAAFAMNFDRIKAFVWDMVSQVVAAIASLPGRVGAAVSGVFDAITKPFRDAKAAIDGIINNISGAVNSIKNKASGFKLPEFKIPGFASGVQNFGGGLAYVHQGEVLANLPRGTDVIPKRDVDKMMGSQTTVNYNAPIYLTTAEATREFFAIQDRNSLLASKGLSVVRA